MAEEERRAELEMRASDTDRERVADRLRTAAGHGRITMDELEERLDAAYAAKTYGELVPLTADLPVEDARAGLDPIAPPVRSSALVVGEQQRHQRSTAIAIMSGANRGGRWIVPKRVRVFAFWGGSVIDLRDARFENGTTIITATAIMGGVQILAPEDVHVRVTGVGVMGGFAESRSNAVGPDNAPVVEVRGLAFWGGVHVKHVERKKKELGS
ncbi:MAG TPA: DUF1707 domain-containing protein [Actinospica sp.]|jgi:hypothetical protein|nr:DUF1707 domain-containing protein [Actinospica sp.]